MAPVDLGSTTTPVASAAAEDFLVPPPCCWWSEELVVLSLLPSSDLLGEGLLLLDLRLLPSVLQLARLSREPLAVEEEAARAPGVTSRWARVIFRLSAAPPVVEEEDEGVVSPWAADISVLLVLNV